MDVVFAFEPVTTVLTGLAVMKACAGCCTAGLGMRDAAAGTAVAAKKAVDSLSGSKDDKKDKQVGCVAKTHRDAGRCVIASSTHPTGLRPSPAGARSGSTLPLN